jgi:hypothetical protein
LLITLGKQPKHKCVIGDARLRGWRDERDEIAGQTRAICRSTSVKLIAVN